MVVRARAMARGGPSHAARGAGARPADQCIHRPSCQRKLASRWAVLRLPARRGPGDASTGRHASESWHPDGRCCGSRHGGGPAPHWTPAFAGVTGANEDHRHREARGWRGNPEGHRTATRPPAPPGQPPHPRTVMPAQAVMPAKAGIQMGGAAAPEGVGAGPALDSSFRWSDGGNEDDDRETATPPPRDKSRSPSAGIPRPFRPWRVRPLGPSSPRRPRRRSCRRWTAPHRSAA